MRTTSLQLSYRFSFATGLERKKPPYSLASPSDWAILLRRAKDFRMIKSSRSNGYIPEWWVEVQNGLLDSPVKASSMKGKKPSVMCLSIDTLLRAILGRMLTKGFLGSKPCFCAFAGIWSCHQRV